ncbi:MAG: hypothetical protein QM785_00645 [Pyrinomonadaceae bacterium]
MTVREKLISDLRSLDDLQLAKVADYLTFLKSRVSKTSKKINRDKKIDPIFGLGKDPVDTGVTDASEELDSYLY